MESAEDFMSVAQWFIDHAHTIEDGWSIENEKDAEKYFIKKTSFLKLYPASKELIYSEEDDEQCVTYARHLGITCQAEHHIMYNQSYGIPVIYFSIIKPSGKRVSLEDVWHHLKSTVVIKDPNMWSLLSEQIHPIFQRPYYAFHPCQTSDLISQICSSTPRSFFLTWLSSIGPYALLNLSLKYADLIKEAGIE